MASHVERESFKLFAELLQRHPLQGFSMTVTVAGSLRQPHPSHAPRDVHATLITLSRSKALKHRLALTIRRKT